MSGPEFQGFAHPSRSRFCQEKIVWLKRFVRAMAVGKTAV